MKSEKSSGHWPGTVDEVLGGDQAVVLAYATPAGGVVLSPVTNFGIRDSDAGTVTVNSSIGAWKKLERLRRNPRVALVYHTREHGFSDRSEYVVVQGVASLSEPDPDYSAKISENWERFLGRRATGPLWERWLRIYHTRVSIAISVERLVVWPTLDCHGSPTVYGTALPATAPESQQPPARGTGPRLNHVRAARSVARLPNVLLGWIGVDRFPMVVPVKIAGTTPEGIVLDTPDNVAVPGSRRAGLTAHSFTRYVRGQTQRLYTGWLETHSGNHRVRYAPHTERGYRLPPSRLLYNLAVGFETRRWGSINTGRS